MPFPEGFPTTREAFLTIPDLRNTRFFRAYVDPQTLDEVEWRMEMKFGHCLPLAVAGFKSARVKMDELLCQGYIEVGVINLSIIGGFYETEVEPNPLRFALRNLDKQEYRIVSYFFADDDRRGHVFARGVIVKWLLKKIGKISK